MIEITTLDDPRVSPFSRLTEAQLRMELEPENGLFIAESPKVIRVALDAGWQPMALLCERKHIEGDARDIIPTLGERYDLVFIDANKRQYVEYYDLVMDYLNDGGFMIADNTLWAGKVVDPKAQREAQTRGILAFNDHVKHDPRVEKVIIPLRDGLTLIHKLPQ